MNFPANEQLGPALSHADRRVYPRFTVQVQIELHEEGSDVPTRAETADLSRGGCYVQLNLTLSLGSYLNGRLWLDSEPVEFRGRVVTRHPQFGNGIMFLHFEGNGEQILGRYLEAIVN